MLKNQNYRHCEGW